MEVGAPAARPAAPVVPDPGRAARTTTWRILDEFIDEHTSAVDVPEPARKRPAKKAAKKATRKPAAGTSAAIGSNPARRYGSATSRSLASRS